MSTPTPQQLAAANMAPIPNPYAQVLENGDKVRAWNGRTFVLVTQAPFAQQLYAVPNSWEPDGPVPQPVPVPVPTPPSPPTPPPTPTAGPSGFARPAVPEGLTETVWQDFPGDSLSALGITAGAGKNAEGAFWAPWHVTVENSIATIAGYPDTSLVGQWSVTEQELAGVNNWISGQFGVTSPLIGTASKVRILVAMRADSLPGLTTLALVTGKTGEGDFVELNAPLKLNAGTIHWNGWTEQEYAQESDDLTQWGIRGIQWGITPGQIDLLKQTTPTGPLTVWKSFALPAGWAANMYLALQQQTNDAIYNSGTPTFPANNPNVTASNPIKQEHDWVQICTTEGA